MSVAFKSPYKFMERWFNEKYPYYKEMLVKSDNGEVEWNVLALIRQAKEQAEKAATTFGIRSIKNRMREQLSRIPLDL